MTPGTAPSPLAGPATLIAPARARWERLTRLQQIALIGGAAVLVVLIIIFATYTQQTSYSVLFSNLSAQDGAAITAKLKASKIPYQLASNGSVILVPANVVDDTRLMLAGAGLPSNGVVGFEIFDKSNPLTMTDFTQQLDYQRGLEGELARTIEQIHGVTGAWVNIVLPQSSLYTQSQDQPTASIVVGLSPEAQLDPGQVKAIMHLVASAVQGLKPENVTVVNTDGVNLSDMVQSASAGTGITPATIGTALDVEHQFEQNLSQQAVSMLNTVLGNGKAVVRVNAALNWDQLQQDSTTYGQQPNQIANQSTNTITSNQGGTPVSGPPGTGSNLVPTPTVNPTATGGSYYNQTQINTTYNVSQTMEHLTKAPGSIQRLTVAVFLDGTYPPATVTAIQQAVSDSIGLNTTRGDLITVSALPFNRTNEVAAQAALKAQQQQVLYDQIGHAALIGSVVLALLYFAWRATRPRRAGKAAATTISMAPGVVGLRPATGEGGLLLPAGEQEPGAIMLTAGNPQDILAEARQRQQSEAEQKRRLALHEEVTQTARNHPDLLANVIMSWIEE